MTIENSLASPIAGTRLAFGLALLASIGVLVRSGLTAVGPYYAAPTVLGTGDCLSQANACTVAAALKHGGPDVTVFLLDGTYTGASSMIVPPPGVKGAAAHYFTIRALHDGAAFIDGENARSPVRLGRGTDYVWIEGFDAAHGPQSSSAVVDINGNFNIVKRVIAWDAAENYNAHTIAINGTHDNGTAAGYGNLIEDCGAFGTGRFSFIHYKTHGNTIRRTWLRHEGSYNSGPHSTLELSYFSYNLIADNLILRWDERLLSQPYTLMNNGAPLKGAATCRYGGQLQPDSSCLMPPYHDFNPDGLAGEQVGPGSGTPVGNRLSGFLVLVTTDDKVSVPYAYSITKGGSTIRDSFVYAAGVTDLGNGRDLVAYRLNNDPGNASTITNFTGIAPGTTDLIGTSWTATNRFAAPTLGALASLRETLYDGTHGAHLKYRYQDGVLTNVPLWPWPMSARILAATMRASADSHHHQIENIDAEVQAIFGSYPVAATPPLAATGTPTASLKPTSAAHAGERPAGSAASWSGVTRVGVPSLSWRR